MEREVWELLCSVQWSVEQCIVCRYCILYTLHSMEQRALPCDGTHSHPTHIHTHTHRHNTTHTLTPHTMLAPYPNKSSPPYHVSAPTRCHPQSPLPSLLSPPENSLIVSEHFLRSLTHENLLLWAQVARQGFRRERLLVQQWHVQRQQESAKGTSVPLGSAATWRWDGPPGKGSRAGAWKDTAAGSSAAFRKKGRKKAVFHTSLFAPLRILRSSSAHFRNTS